MVVWYPRVVSSDDDKDARSLPWSDISLISLLRNSQSANLRQGGGGGHSGLGFPPRPGIPLILTLLVLVLLLKHFEHLLLLLLVVLPDLGDEGAEGDDEHVDGDERHVDEGEAQGEVLLLEALQD
jgi:hypothetical protein